MRPIGLLSLMIIGSVAFAPGIGHTQDLEEREVRHVSVSIGLFDYDLPNSGLAPMFAIRGVTPISTVLMLEAGIVGSRPEQAAGNSSTFFAPEAQVQLGFPFSSVRPYIGLGGGAALDLRSSARGGSQTDFTISGSFGLRTWFNDRLGMQVEYRIRGIGADFEGSTTEYTAGVAYAL